MPHTESQVTEDMCFHSHVDRLTDAAVALVNALTPGHAGGHPFEAPSGMALADAIVEALRRPDYATRPSLQDARLIAVCAAQARTVFEALEAGDTETAVGTVNRMLVDSDVRPCLYPASGGGHGLYFRGPDGSFGRSWAAGIAAGLAMAVDGDLGGRLGVCSAPLCDRVYLDASRSAHRRFCSTRCQSRVNSAARRRRRAEFARRPG
ncbi:CGNR zinc finger domain-containing protein [Austwickia chelonae]|nr:CGNR zinc finger domain-containing protein [Austwickia chelonae]